MLFISSYVPLYFLLITKNILERCTNRGKFIINIEKLKQAVFFNEINDYAIIILSFLIVISILFLKRLIKNEGDTHYYTIIEVEEQTGTVYFNYISIYLLSCLGLTLSNITDVFVLFFLMLIVGFIYISNHMTYMNPLFQLLGYKIYEGNVSSKSTNKSLRSVIIVPKDIELNKDQEYIGTGKEDFIFISKANLEY